MGSIGNDIVDLNFIDKKRTCESRFFSKILSPSEQELFRRPEAAPIPFEVYVWLLWSAKEAAYKFLKRYQPDLVFSPTKIICNNLELTQDTSSRTCFGTRQDERMDLHDGLSIRRLTDGTTLVLSYGEYHLFASSVITADYIHTIVNDSAGFSRINYAIRKIAQDDHESQSKAVRELAIEQLTTLYPGYDIAIIKADAGYPAIVKDGELQDTPLSFAHHGHYAGYAMLSQS